MNAMPLNVRIRLSVMMFLQYMMFAVWFVQLAGYLDKIGVTGTLKALIVGSMALGSLVSPIFCMIADRHFASQKVLMAMNFACAVLLFLAALVSSPVALFVLLLLAMICYMPTWSLTAAVAMAHAPSEKFPQIRVFGSIGWAAAGLFGIMADRFFNGAKIDGTNIPLFCGAAVALVAALLNLTLPNTPPPSKGKPASIIDVLGLRALGLLKSGNFAFFMLISMLAMIPFTMYFSLGSQFFMSQGFKQVTATMNLGQVAEILIMLLVPIALTRYGAKWAITAGLGMLLVRYIAFLAGGVLGQPSLYYVAILVHGAIFGFLIVGGQVYVDKKAPPEIKAQAQGLVGLLLFGVGMLVGTFFNVNLIEMYTAEKLVDGVAQNITNWNAIWVILTAISAVLMAGFWVLFRDDVLKAATAPQTKGPGQAEAARRRKAVADDRNMAVREPQDRNEGEVQPPPRGFFGTLRKLGPGMIIAGSIVGSGELILTTKAGAEAGFWLLWLIIIGCVIKVSTQIEFARHTITWGQTPLKALNGVPGPKLRVNWLVAYWTFMTVLIVIQQGGILGGVGQTLAMSCPLTASGSEYNGLQDRLTQNRIELRLLESHGEETPRVAVLQEDIASLGRQLAGRPEPNDPYVWAAILAAVTSLLLYLGRYRAIQFVSTALVAIFTLVTVFTLVALQMKEQWAVTTQDLAAGLSFHLPPADSGGGNPIRTALGAFGIIGIGASELIMYPYWCLEKGYARCTGPRDGTAAWTDRARGWIRVLRIDAWSSMVVYTLATVAFYLLGAAVLGRVGLNPEGRDMVRTLAAMYIPVFGPLAHPLFLCGAFAVLYSTLFVAAAGNSRMVADGMGLYGFTDGSEAARETWTRRVSAVWPFIALVLYMFVRAPALMIVTCGIAQSIMLPLLGGAALYFRYRRSDPNLRSGRLWDVMLWIAFAAFAVVGVWSVYAVFEPFLVRWIGQGH